MLKYLAMGGVFLLIASSYGGTFYLGADWKKNQIEAKQATDDNKKLIQIAQNMVNSYQQVTEGLKGLAFISDDTTVGDSIAYSLDRLCQQRQQSGHPCTAPKPAKPPLQVAGRGRPSN